MMIRTLPLIVAFAPLVGVTAAYSLNIRADVLTACIPFIDGCTSISATGRYMPGSMAFRAALLPHAGLLMIFWWFAREWLGECRRDRRGTNAVFLFGLVGAFALIVYVTFLGTTLPFYEFMRRFGIYFYFLGTALAQVSLTLAMPASALRRAMLAIVTTPFLIGIANLVLKAILDDTDRLENSFEWIAALLMQTWFCLLFLAWERSRMTVTVTTVSSVSDEGNASSSRRSDSA